jgi:hypothetical protein
VSQRVNIQYTIEMSELTAETTRLLGQSYDRIHEISTRIEVTDDVLSLATLQEIDALRQDLAKIDYRLNDIANIINGYLKFSTSSDEGSHGSDMESAIASAATLEEKLQEFKHSLASPDANSD